MAGNISSLGIGGVPATKSIVNAYSSGGVSSASLVASTSSNGAKETLSGELTAGTLATIVTISQAGQIPYLAAYSKDTTERTIRLQVTVDGTVVFDATSNSISTSSSGLMAAGQIVSSNSVQGAPIRFSSSCVIKVASSLTETDKVAVAHSLI